MEVYCLAWSSQVKMDCHDLDHGWIFENLKREVCWVVRVLLLW
jgi:hypothetical protein